ncbi:MAG: hypothetical protein JWN03_3733 [Nocardia sp.]|uniref:DUF6585 family protein n=1 Tax=Nocardia sp. TaxID=1821 RepID=UPI002636E188|nr:DUF6585 family protein [Nocardia sp.]MCU1643458.1 hypothetical protein [Nocardia sp.]
MSGGASGTNRDPERLRCIAEAAQVHGLGRHRKGYLAAKGDARLDLYENGCTVATGREVRVARYDSTMVWQKIIRVHRNGVHTHTSHEYRIIDLGGAEVKMTEAITSPDEWGPQLVEAVAARQARGASDAVRAGRRVEFGPWWISACELGAGKKTLALQDLRAFRVQQGQAVIEAGEQTRLTQGIDEIPNFLVLRHLLRQARPDLPESAGKVFGRRRLVRHVNQAIAVVAVVAFGLACMVGWPVEKAELCGKLSRLQAARSELTGQLKDLRNAAENYRGADQDGVRADSDKLGKFTSSGYHWLKAQDLDRATTSIRAVCQANSFSK